jgi:hypothetical protein
MNRKDHVKRNEWLEFRAKHPSSASWKDVYNWVKDPKSAFHDELKWTEKEIREDYYRKACTSLLMRCDKIYCNVATSYQRLHMTYDHKHLAKGVKSRVARIPSEIAKSEEELAHVRAMIWQRLRRVTSDIYEFREYLPEFFGIYTFLIPKVSSEMQSPDFQGGSQILKGSAAQ